jgi:chemotaxis response regulator CheB
MLVPAASTGAVPQLRTEAIVIGASAGAIDALTVFLPPLSRSGANDDGAAGAASVRQQGGRVYVQRPEQALAPAMPEAAIRHAKPQFVGSLEEIAALPCDATGQST